MITSKPIDNGYEFYNKGQLIAIGGYTTLGFELCELSNNISVHANGMLGLSYLRSKYTPEFYKTPVSPRHVIPTVPLRASKRLDNFMGHPALKGVWPLATENPNGNV